MGYEVTRRRVYGPEDRYCNGSGLSVLKSTLAEAEATYNDMARDGACGYPAAMFLIDGACRVLRQTGPSLAEVDRAMVAAYRRRYPTVAQALK